MSRYRDQYRGSIRGANGNVIGLPEVSTRLDSLRNYQFEVKFTDCPVRDEVGVNSISNLTLAAKQVAAFGGKIGEIKTSRVNDVLFFPGKFEPQTLSITFDQLYENSPTRVLWAWYRAIHDQISGNAQITTRVGGGSQGTFKATKMQIIELDGAKNPIAYIDFFGAWPINFEFSEKNYNGTQDFSTVKVDFRFDFMDYRVDSSNPTSRAT